MAIGKMRYQVFCSARLQWNGKKLEPFKRVRAMGHAEQECRTLVRNNPGAVAVAFGPGGYKFTAYANGRIVP